MSGHGQSTSISSIFVRPGEWPGRGAGDDARLSRLRVPPGDRHQSGWGRCQSRRQPFTRKLGVNGERHDVIDVECKTPSPLLSRRRQGLECREDGRVMNGRLKAGTIGHRMRFRQMGGRRPADECTTGREAFLAVVESRGPACGRPLRFCTAKPVCAPARIQRMLRHAVS